MLNLHNPAHPAHAACPLAPWPFGLVAPWPLCSRSEGDSQAGHLLPLLTALKPCFFRKAATASRRVCASHQRKKTGLATDRHQQYTCGNAIMPWPCLQIAALHLLGSCFRLKTVAGPRQCTPASAGSTLATTCFAVGASAFQASGYSVTRTCSQ